LIPSDADVTSPPPRPALLTVSKNVFGTNDADTCVAASNVTAHEPVPEHPPPDQPANTDPTDGDAVNTTTVPCKNHHEHPRSQLIPAGDDTTDP
jgi:hypothetical protein